ncbi:MAG: acyl-CoA/acyl-ACP dehydrogenase [Proteobacteria bacterium]|nr:acyl-CoA/acyl-ACP dehydrogenase [Pseudomonadota bacterium]
MDFSLNEDQANIHELGRRIFSDGSTDETLRAFARGSEPYDRTLWRALADAGLLGAAIGADWGGSGFGIMELGLLLEEQGRTLAPVPLLATLVLGALPLQAFGTQVQRDRWLPAIARGEAIVTGALEEVGNTDPALPIATRAEVHGASWRLSGTKVTVPYGKQAACLLVPARLEESVAVFLVDPASAGVTLSVQELSSGEPHAELHLAGVAVGPDALLGAPAAGAAIARWIVQHGRVALAAQQVGVSAEALRRTAAYSSERIQFGRRLGSMQAVQQRAADAFIDVEALRSAYLRAAWLLAQGENAAAEVAAAKYWAALAGHRVVHTAQHLHGGIGADVEYPIHHFFLRAKQIGAALGGATPMLADIGRAIAAGDTAALA